MAPGADGMVPPPPYKNPIPPSLRGLHGSKPLGGIHTIYAWVAVGPQMSVAESLHFNLPLALF